jgi:hypothetical protein
MSISSDSRDPRDLEREIDLILRALHDHGDLDRAGLAAAVRARFWGPGQLRLALREAVRRGDVRQTARGRFTAPEPPVSAASVP